LGHQALASRYDVGAADGRASERPARVEELALVDRGGRVVFGPFSLSPGERLLMRDGVPLEIGGRSLDLLVALVEQPGRVLSKRDLLKRVWPDVVVEDGSLRFHMAGLRRILGDGDDGARYITTQVGVGYAFVAPVQRLADAENTVAKAATPPSDPGAPAIGRLPHRMAKLIGRDHDVQLLTERVAETALFSIIGAAGVGKTTLAVEIGHALLADFGGKVRFVDLGAVEDPSLVPSAIANAIGIPVQGEDPVAVVLGHIRAQQWLLVLDNCEHLIDAVSAIVERIGEAAPQVSILATSREPLRVRGEHVHWLGSLDYPDNADGLSREELLAYPAIELFVERAVAANSALAIDLDAARQIAEICRRLDGMALPIELTAVRVATHGIDATARLIGERFSLGWAGRRTALPRQQTLQATLDWSYDLLSEAERRTFERLSVFVGAFSLDAAVEVVVGDDIDAASAAAALDELTAKSLVASNRGIGVNAYRLLEMTRAYAREKLLARDLGAAQTVGRRHAAHYLALLEEVLAPDGSLSNGTARITGQIGNIRAALGWGFGVGGDPLLAVRLAAVSAPVFLNMSLLVECRTWCARAVAALDENCRGTGVELELQAALGLSLMFTRGNSEAAGVALQRALDVAVGLEDRWNQLRLLGRLHIFHERIGDYSAARNWARMALEVADAIGEPEAMGVAASLSGISHHLAGDQKQARRELELALRLSLPSERARTIHYGFDHRNRSAIALARTLWLQGHADRARRLVEETVREAAGLDHPATHCIALIWTLSIEIWSGELARAQATLDTFSAIAEAHALGPYVAAARGFRGQIGIGQGRTGDELGWIEESLARLRAARYDLLTTAFALTLAQGLALSRRQAEAIELLDAMIERCTANGELLDMSELLRMKAGIRWPDGGDPAAAEAVLLEALELSRRQGALAWELRVAMDLARLWRAQNRTTEASDLLATARTAFAEDLDTIDLRAADKLLEELAERATMNVAEEPDRRSSGQ